VRARLENAEGQNGEHRGLVVRGRLYILREVMQALVPRVDVFLHVSHQASGASNQRISPLGDCQGNVERLETAPKTCEGELAFRKRTYQPQEADRAEEARELALGTGSGKY
jgi:hypothetical protein